MIQSKKAKGRRIRLKVRNKEITHYCDECKNKDQSKFSRDNQIIDPGQTEWIIDLVCRECGAREPVDSLVLQCLEIEEQLTDLNESKDNSKANAKEE
jgi:hypothetical protein